MKKLTCLAGADLSSFLHGQTAPLTNDALAAHLEQCTDCTTRIAALVSADGLFDTLRGQATVVCESADFDVQQMVERLRTTAAPDATIGFTSDEDLAQLCLEPAQAPDELGRLGRYRLLSLLGRGGMGVVFRAEDLDLRREVALKVMKASNADTAEGRIRFLREARAASRLQHDNIVPVYQVGEVGGTLYIALPMLAGETLQSRLARDGRLPSNEVIRLGREVAEALAAAHDQGILHRDVKPGNIWLEAPSGRVKLLDFGLARDSASTEPVLTQTGAILGTPAYMSPEQASGEPCDARSDLFSLGCVLYQAVTGERPFRGNNALAILLQLTNHNPTPVAELVPTTPKGLAITIGKLLEKQPANRPTTARQVIEMLGIAELQSQRPVKTPRSRRWAIAAIAASLLVVAAITAQVVIKYKDKNGNEVTFTPPEGATDVRVVQPPLQPVKAGDPMSQYALVTNPAAIEGVISWDIVPVLHQMEYELCRVSPDGKRLAIKGNYLVSVFNLESQQFVQAFQTRPGHYGTGLPFDWSPDGKRLAIAEWGNLSIWDIESGTLIVKAAIEDMPENLRWSEKGDLLAAHLYHQKRTALIDAKTGSEHLSLPFQTAHFAFSPDGTHFAGWDVNGCLRLVDTKTGKILTPPEKFVTPDVFGPTRVAWSPDGATLAVNGKMPLLLDVATGKVDMRFGTEYDNANRFAFIEEGKKLLTDRAIWDVATGKLVVAAPKDTNLLTPNLAVMQLDKSKGQFLLVDVATGKARDSISPGHALQAIDAYLTPFAMSPDNSRLVVHSGHLLDAASGKSIGRVGNGGSYDFSPDGKQIFRWGFERYDSNGLLEAALPELTAIRHGHIQTGALSPDGRMLAGITASSKLAFHDLTTGKTKEYDVLPKKNTANRHSCVWSGDGKRLAIDWPSADSQIIIWDVAAEKIAKKPTMPNNDNNCWPIAFSPDGKYLHNADTVWDLELDKAVVLEGAGRPLTWSADGKRFFTADKTAPSLIAEYDWTDPTHPQLRTFPVDYNVIWQRPWGSKWSPDRKTHAYLRNGFVALSAIDAPSPRVIFVEFSNGTLMVVNSEGHYRSTRTIQAEIAYLVRTKTGQEVLTPSEFSAKYRWKNDPERVRPVGP